MAGTSRVNREVYARFCGRLEVKSLRPTPASDDECRHAGLRSDPLIFEPGDRCRRRRPEPFTSADIRTKRNIFVTSHGPNAPT
jgi:hypothetical protein